MAGSFEALRQLFPAFTPGSALAGGLLVGLAASLLLASIGRIAGISGIVGRLWQARPHDRRWRWVFLAGLLLGAWLAHALSLGPPDPVRHGLAPGWLAAAGLLVGWGTTLGNGCTSGHGVCGLGLRSSRSLVATLVFVGVAIATSFVLRHALGWLP